MAATAAVVGGVILYGQRDGGDEADAAAARAGGTALTPGLGTAPGSAPAGAGGVAAPAPTQPQPPGDGWSRVSAASGIFSVDLPPHTSDHQTVSTPAGPVTADLLMADRDDWGLLVAELAVPSGVEADLRGAADGMLANLGGRITVYDLQKSQLVELAEFEGVADYEGTPLAVRGRILRTRIGAAIVVGIGERHAVSQMMSDFQRVRDSLAINR